MMSEGRFDRSELLFDKEGQQRIKSARIAIMGAGGLGSFVVAECALLGFGHIYVIDNERLATSNRNRYLGAWHDDPVQNSDEAIKNSGSRKVDLAERHIKLIDPDIICYPIYNDILSSNALNAIKSADYVLGCVDSDGVRFFLNEACHAYGKPYIDMASDVPEEKAFGGRVAVITDNQGCLSCLDLLNTNDLQKFFSSKGMLENEQSAYGIHDSALGETGPSVVSMNGVVASLGVSALMKLAVGWEVKYAIMTYRGDCGTVRRCLKAGKPADCPYCSNRGSGDEVKLKRYFKFAQQKHVT